MINNNTHIRIFLNIFLQNKDEIYFIQIKNIATCVFIKEQLSAKLESLSFEEKENIKQTKSYVNI